MQSTETRPGDRSPRRRGRDAFNHGRASVALSTILGSAFIQWVQIFDDDDPSIWPTIPLAVSEWFVVLFCLICLMNERPDHHPTAALYALAMIMADNLLAAGVFLVHGFIISGVYEPEPKIADAFYFAIVTWTTLGYGDMSPPAGGLRLFAANHAFLGYFSIGLVIAMFASLVGAKNRFDTDAFDGASEQLAKQNAENSDGGRDDGRQSQG